MKHNPVFEIILYGIAGFIIVGFFGGFEMAALGCVLGFMVYLINSLRNRTKNLELELETLKKLVAREYDKKESASEANTPQPVPHVSPPTSPDSRTVSQQDDIKKEPRRKKGIEIFPASGKPAAKPSAFSDFSNRFTEKIKFFFTQGNVVVKVGVIVLFFGVGFLFKYAADHSLLPIEFRLSFAGLAGILLVITGFRLRHAQKAYSTVIQGGGIGIFYLTVFAAAKLYSLVPLPFAFFVMIGIGIFSGILAVLEDAKFLAVFGIIGGFLSPVLMSTGTGSHVALFSYYALLNCGIFGIAWFKSWRILNWLGFVFTFVIGTAWGFNYYQPKYFSSTEPFLILHFLFYAAISVIFAFKQPVKLKGYLDGTLVFGLPVICFGLQSTLVKDFEFGMAFSALFVGGFYILLCLGLWKQKIEGMRLLVESFLSLGIVFLSLAIPFAFDSGWTSGVWALEGAGILWIGLRQNRITARYFGLLLQLFSAVSFLETIDGPVKNIPVMNAIFLSCLCISIAGFLTNYFLTLYGWSKPTGQKKNLFLIPMIWGILWWFAGGLYEINFHIYIGYQIQSILIFISGSGLLMSFLGLKLNWKDIQYPVMGLPFATLLIAVICLLTGLVSHPSYKWGSIAYILTIMIQYGILFRHEKSWNSLLMGYLHRATLYFVIILLSWETAFWIEQSTRINSIWSQIAWGGMPAICIVLLTKTGYKISWPVKKYKTDYLEMGLFPVVICLGIWTLSMCLNPADPAPLPYIPIANPADLAQVFSILIILKWAVSMKKCFVKKTSHMILDIGHYLTAALAFLWMNSVIARCVHHWTLTPFSMDSMLGSVHFQTSISILWTIIALGSMVIAHKKAWRNIWFTGACLLAIVVMKLFLIDLDKIGTIARIVSFLVVGGLMLIIGYFSPLPPKKEEVVSP